jgi:predicted transcriptional regulator YheO
VLVRNPSPPASAKIPPAIAPEGLDALEAVNRLPVGEMSEVKDALIAIARAIAATSGPQCEVVLHDYAEWRRSGSTIIWIENGHVTGRRVGGPTTNLGLEALKAGGGTPDRFNYQSRSKDGRTLRSSSIYFRNRAGRLIGSLCINVDVDAYVTARAALDSILSVEPSQPSDTDTAETFGTDIAEVLDAQIQAAIARTGKPAAALARDDRVAVVGYLDDKGAFLVKRAADRIARALGTSRVTVYAYLEEARSSGDSTNGRRG